MAGLKPLKGMRDLLPQQQIRREYLFEKIKEVFRKHGFDPIETPAIEYWEVLSGKYGAEEKLIYRFQDRGGRDVGLRYDLTVPLARFFASNQGNITKPFKRYQIQPVWRAEKPQKGRFREFYQCDIDIVGSRNPLSDAQIIITIREALRELGIYGFQIKVNHRKFLSAIARHFGIQEREVEFARILDKLDKVGLEGIEKEYMEKGFPKEVIKGIMDILKNPPSLEEIVEIIDNQDSLSAYENLKRIFLYLKKTGVEEAVFDISLARGLDYYTGMVFEIVLTDVPIGSISGGGRYDNLIEIFTKYPVPAVGGSIGIDRLITAMEEMGLFREFPSTYTDALICYFNMDEKTFDYAMEIKGRLDFMNVDIYSGDAKMRGQLAYAAERGIRWAIIIGEDEISRRTVSIKDLKRRTQDEISIDELANYFRTSK